MAKENQKAIQQLGVSGASVVVANDLQTQQPLPLPVWAARTAQGSPARAWAQLAFTVAEAMRR